MVPSEARRASIAQTSFSECGRAGMDEGCIKHVPSASDLLAQYMGVDAQAVVRRASCTVVDMLDRGGGVDTSRSDASDDEGLDFREALHAEPSL